MQKKEKTIPILRPSTLKVFNVIDAYINKNNFAPELTEISEKTKISVRHVHSLINELVELGYLEKIATRRRGLRVIKEIN